MVLNCLQDKRLLDKKEGEAGRRGKQGADMALAVRMMSVHIVARL